MIHKKQNKMKCFLLTFLILLINKNILINSEYYTSIYKMSFLMDTEQKLVEKFESFIKKNEQKLMFLKQ